MFDGQVDSLNLLGNIYINLITALVAPLIFVSIISMAIYAVMRDRVPYRE